MRSKDQWQEIAKKYKSSRKPVIQLDDNNNEIKRFNTVKDAANEMGVSITAISCCCRGKTLHAAGYKWKFL
jgi:ribonucleotide reductase alpha subunit